MKKTLPIGEVLYLDYGLLLFLFDNALNCSIYVLDGYLVRSTVFYR